VISSRAIALQGVGFAAALLAAQGFGPTEVDVVAPTPVSVQAPSGAVGGGSSHDGGRGWIKKDHGWVKATKWAKFGAWDFNAVVSVQAGRHAQLDQFTGRDFDGVAHAKAQSRACLERFQACNYVGRAEASAVVTHQETLQFAQATDYFSTVDYLGGDELLILLEYMR
jgi:hypothetical protein